MSRTGDPVRFPRFWDVRGAGVRDREGFDVVLDDVRGVRRGRAESTSTKGRGECPQVAGSSQEQEAMSAVAGHRNRGKRGRVAALFDEMVAVAVQAVLSSV